VKKLINVKIILYLVFILTGCATTTVRLPDVKKEQVRERKGKEYIFLPGDSLSKLADKFYDDHYAWPAIEEATNDKAEIDRNFNKIDTLKISRLVINYGFLMSVKLYIFLQKQR